MAQHNEGYHFACFPHSLCERQIMDQHNMGYPFACLSMPRYDYRTWNAMQSAWALNELPSGQQDQCDRGSWHTCGEVNKEKRMELVDPKDHTTFRGRVWSMARHSDGCRILQGFFDDIAFTHAAKLELVLELVSYVWEAIQDKNANHVIQKIIFAMNPDDVNFIIDEIMAAGAWHVARHCFGCRVVERLLEHCSKKQIEKLVVAILQDAVGLCKHQYGNFVAQEMLEHCALEHQQTLIGTVIDHVVSLCTDYHGVAVVSQALSSGTAAARVSVSHSVLRHPSILLSMARSRHGQEAVKRLLQVPDKQAREDVFRLLSDNVEELQRSRYGRVIAKHLSTLDMQPRGSEAQDDKAPEEAKAADTAVPQLGPAPPAGARR
jgi:hypothetical protein